MRDDDARLLDINLERIWETARQDIPRLISRPEPLVPPKTEP